MKHSTHLINTTAKKAERLVNMLQGETYMKFHVDWGQLPGPTTSVSVSSDYEGSREEFLSMLMYVLADLAATNV